MNNNHRYWTYAPGENASCWEEFRTSGIMALSFHSSAKKSLEDYKDEEDLRAAFQGAAGDEASHKNDVRALWDFLTVMKPGDLVFAKKGTRTFLGAGRVSGEYYFEDRPEGMCHRRKVEWFAVAEKVIKDKAPIKTLTDITPYPNFLANLAADYDLKDAYAFANHCLWNDFLKKWPIADLRNMKLEDYTAIGGKDSFCYWIESRLEKLGSIWGGSAYKFGIFEFDKTNAKDLAEDKGAAGDDRYRWYAKYGKNAEEVFDCVKSRIVEIAEASARGDLNAVDSVDFSHAVKWKIAFLYQRQDKMDILDIYKKEMLAKFLGAGVDASMPELCQMASKRIAESPDVFVLSRWGWPTDVKKVDEIKDVETYGEKDFLNEVFVTKAEYDDTVSLLKAKKNIILTGAPGVGKTYAARRLAWAMMGAQDDARIEFVQFHQSYAYEDFICGYKPTSTGGFCLRNGVFYNFCKKAEQDLGRPYFFIIDEINRGNLSKIFGELLMLIEADKRGRKSYAVRLAYKPDEPFVVPGNLYLIGMMNTADRSLAMMDYALRRRFSFVPMTPGFDTEGFTALVAGNAKMQKLVAAVKKLNEVIVSDTSLGKGFVIGHSFFCGDSMPEQIVQYDIGPTLDEYWFDNPAKAEDEKAKLLNALK